MGQRQVIDQEHDPGSLREPSHDVVPLVAEFNPWHFANSNQLGERFFDEIGVLLGRGTLASAKEQKALVRRWRLYSLYLRTAADILDFFRRNLTRMLLLSGLILVATGIAERPLWSVGIGLAILTRISSTQQRHHQVLRGPSDDLGER